MSKLYREPDIDFAGFAPEMGSGLPDDSGTFRRYPSRRGRRPTAKPKPVDRTDAAGTARALGRLLVIGDGAEELCRRTPATSSGSRFEVITARDGDGARAALEDGAPDAILVHLGVGAAARMAALREILPHGVPKVVLVEAAADGDGALQLGADALLATRPGESLGSAGARALEVCRVLVTGAPATSAASRGYALLQETHRRLLARTVEARLGQAMVVHDLRTPIGVLRGVHAELGEAPGESQLHLLGIMERALGQLEALVNRLEDLHAPARRENRERLDVFELARTIAEEAQLTAPGRHKTVEVRGEGPLYWSGERQMMERVLLNLVGNALRHSRSRVEIRVENSHGSLRLTVLDDGPGLPKELREELFRRYVRDPETGRLGLGLAIVQSAVEQAGGRVRAYNCCELSDEGASGACFVVRLPHW